MQVREVTAAQKTVGTPASKSETPATATPPTPAASAGATSRRARGQSPRVAMASLVAARRKKNERAANMKRGASERSKVVRPSARIRPHHFWLWRPPPCVELRSEERRSVRRWQQMNASM